MQKINKFKKNVPQIIIILFGVFYILLGISNYVEPHNEGEILYGSKLVSEGLLPYKDFYTLNTPGVYLFIGLLFNLFGTEVIIAKIATAVINIFIAIIIYLISIKTLKRAKLLPYILASSWLGGFYYYGNTVSYGLFFALLSGFLLFNYFETKNEKWYHLAGIAIGFTAVFRHEMGAYLFGAIFQAIFFFNLSNKELVNKKISTKILFGLKKALIFGLFTLAPLPIAIYLLSNIEFSLLWDSLIIQPFTIYREFESTPFPFPFGSYFNIFVSLVFYLPLLVFIYSIISIIRRTRSKRLELNGVQFWKEMTLFNLGINLFNHGQVVSDLPHIMPAMLIAGILIFYHLNREKYQIIYSFLFLSILILMPVISRVELENKSNIDYAIIKSLANRSMITIDYNYINNNYVYFFNKQKNIKYFNMQKGISDSINKSDFQDQLEFSDIIVENIGRENKNLYPLELSFIQEEINKRILIDSNENFRIYSKH